MAERRYSEFGEEEQDWIDAYLDGTIDQSAFDSLQDRMLQSPELRAVMRRYLALDNSLRNEGDAGEPAQAAWLELSEDKSSVAQKKIARFPLIVQIAAAAAIAFLFGLALMHWRAEPGQPVTAESEETFAEGFAVVSRLFDAHWQGGLGARREGDTLGAETFRLASGAAEIQFFLRGQDDRRGPRRDRVEIGLGGNLPPGRGAGAGPAGPGVDSSCTRLRPRSSISARSSDWSSAMARVTSRFSMARSRCGTGTRRRDC